MSHRGLRRIEPSANDDPGPTRRTSSRRRGSLFACVAALLSSCPLLAQEPRPVELVPSYFEGPEGVNLDFSWRYSPDAGSEGALPELGDDDWRPVRPALGVTDLPPSGWSGAGWFRRHVIVDPELRDRDIALRLTAPGVAQVFLDGHLVLDTGSPGNRSEVPADRRDAVLVRFEHERHLLAVRYLYPAAGPRLASGIGFRLSLANPALAKPSPESRDWRLAAQGAMVGLPLFLVFLHLALFAFDPSARENLFYAMEMAAFGLVVVRDLPDLRMPTQPLRELLDDLSAGGPVLAIFFGLLTYYAVRTDPMPRTWRAFAAVSALGVVLCAFVPAVVAYGWMPLFVAMVAEVVRVERSGRTVDREGAPAFVAAFAVFVVAIVLQILVNLGVVPPIAGVRNVYFAGILISAVGMSLFLARTLGRSRQVAAENERKSRELARARELQLSMLPRHLPRVPGLDIAATSRTATEVGGDYYDVRPAADGTLLLAVGDATGHGLAAGVVVTATKAVFSTLDPEGAPGALLAACHRTLRGMRLGTLRMSLLLGRLSPHGARWANAAMPLPLVHRAADGTVDDIGSGGLPLGTTLEDAWPEVQVALSPGDTLLFASDGLPELLDAGDRELGYAGVAEAFSEACRRPTAEAVLAALVETAERHSGSRPLADDLTVVVVRVARTVSASDPGS